MDVCRACTCRRSSDVDALRGCPKTSEWLPMDVCAMRRWLAARLRARGLTVVDLEPAARGRSYGWVVGDLDQTIENIKQGSTVREVALLYRQGAQKHLELSRAHIRKGGKP